MVQRHDELVRFVVFDFKQIIYRDLLARQIAQRGFTSNCVGVYWYRRAGKWYGRAYINQNDDIYVGLFADEQLAAKAVDDALASQGLARVNFPEDTTSSNYSPRPKKHLKYRGVTYHKKVKSGTRLLLLKARSNMSGWLRLKKRLRAWLTMQG